MADQIAAGTPAADLPAEDAKLATLARGARGRVGAAEGAAVRDETGRTYSGATVALGSLALSALRLAVAQAAASGARGLEAAVVVRRDADLDALDVEAVRDLGGPGVPVVVVGTDAVVLAVVTT
ncbi:cytidine deaminase [Longivirga aurantiaca]|uniref:Cytidine deaminase n=1 Tax=Longivirga aurantiaca TaxID=1837743 RepID=A0ABW1T419_9ACTN